MLHYGQKRLWNNKIEGDYGQKIPWHRDDIWFVSLIARKNKPCTILEGELSRQKKEMQKPPDGDELNLFEWRGRGVGMEREGEGRN